MIGDFKIAQEIPDRTSLGEFFSNHLLLSHKQANKDSILACPIQFANSLSFQPTCWRDHIATRAREWFSVHVILMGLSRVCSAFVISGDESFDVRQFSM